MVKNQALTTSNIVSILKKAGFTTKDDLQKLRGQINEDQFEARTEFYAKMTKPELDRIEEKIDKLDTKFSAEISWLKDDIKGLTAEFATTTSKKAILNN